MRARVVHFSCTFIFTTVASSMCTHNTYARVCFEQHESKAIMADCLAIWNWLELYARRACLSYDIYVLYTSIVVMM